MSLQWSIIAAFLYAEIAAVLFLLMPFFSARTWQKLFRSRFLNSLRSQAGIYFYILLAILILFFLDAIREMHKYSSEDNQNHPHLDSEMQVNMRLFRAQRNFYLSGFALFLSLVIRRLVLLISTQATLLAESEAAFKQAASATEAAKKLMSQGSSGGEAAQNDSNEARDKEVKRLGKKLEEAEEMLEKERANVTAMKAQAESVSEAYDQLLREHRRLQGEAGNRKEE